MDSQETTCYQCAVCGTVYRIKQYADDCCKPRFCEICGKQLPSSHMYIYINCPECRSKQEKKHMEDVFEKSKKVPLSEAKYDYFFSESYLYEDGYFEDIDYLLDCCTENGTEVPDHIWATKEVELKLDATDIICNALEQADLDLTGYADMPEKSIKKLQKHLDEFCKEVGFLAYVVDYETSVLLSEEDRKLNK